MHLTRFEIHRGRRGAQKLLGSPQAMHAALSLAFPSGPVPDDTHDPLDLTPVMPASEPDSRLLWRVDDDGRRAVLYLVSSARPDLTHLVEQAGWPAQPGGWATRGYGPFLDALVPGQRWAFRLTANPSHAVRLDGEKRSQRLGHVTVEHQTRWLLARAAGRGVRILTTAEDPDSPPALIVHHRQVRGFTRRDPDGGRRGTVTLTTAVYDGQLEVLDVGLLRKALTQGIGPAKAYGCGLLTLARINTA